MLNLNEYIVENLFDVVETSDGPVYYASTKEKDGWMVVWPDGQCLHTYHYPPNFLEE